MEWSGTCISMRSARTVAQNRSHQATTRTRSIPWLQSRDRRQVLDHLFPGIDICYNDPVSAFALFGIGINACPRVSQTTDISWAHVGSGLEISPSSCTGTVSNAQHLTRHLHPFDSIRHLLLRNLARKVRVAMLRFAVDRERREATVVRCSELVNRYVFRRRDECVTDFFWRFDARIQRVYDPDVGDLFLS